MSALDSRLPERGGAAPRRAPQQLYRPPGQRERYRAPSRQQEEPPAERRPPRQLYVPPRCRRAGFNRASSPGFSTCSEIVTSWRAEPEVLRARPPPGPRRRISQQTRQHVQSIAEAKWRQEDGGYGGVNMSRPQSRQESERGSAPNQQIQRRDLSDSRQSLDGSTPERSPTKRPGRRRRRDRRARSRSEDRTAAEQPPSFQLLTFPLPPTATAPHPPHVPWRSNSLASLSRAVSADRELPHRGPPPPPPASPPPPVRPASATPSQPTQPAPSPRAPRPQGVYQPPAARRLGQTGGTVESHGRAPGRHGHGQGRPGAESGRAQPHHTTRSGESQARLRDGWGGEKRARSLRGEGGGARSDPRPSCRQAKGRWFDEGVWCSASDVVDPVHSGGLRRPRLRQVSSGSSSEPSSPQKHPSDSSCAGQPSHCGASHRTRSDNNDSDALSPQGMPGRTSVCPLRVEDKGVSENPSQGGERSPGCGTGLVLDLQRAALAQKTGAGSDRCVVGEATQRPPSIESRSGLSTPPHSNSGRISPGQNGATGGRWCVNVSRDSGADDEASPLSCFEEASTGEEVTPLDSDGDASLWFGPYTDDQKASMGMKAETQHRAWPAVRCPEREGAQCRASGDAATDVSVCYDSRTPVADGCECAEFQNAVTESRSAPEHVNGVVEAAGGELTDSAVVREGDTASPDASVPTNSALVQTTDSNSCGGHLNPPLSEDPDETQESTSPAISTTEGSSAPSQLSAAGSLAQPDATDRPTDLTSAEAPCQSPSTSLSLDDDADDSTPFSWADEVDEWERHYTDDGDLQAQVALPEAISDTPRKPIIDYLCWRPESPEWDDTSLPAHVIEVYDFPSSFTTQDLGVIYQEFSGSGFSVKWVDDTHALAVFSSPSCAHEALQKRHPLVRGRPLARAPPQARQKAARCLTALQPYRARPETCALRARRMVATALGLRAQVSPEKRDRERRQLQQAKDKKRLAAKQKEDAWEGKF